MNATAKNTLILTASAGAGVGLAYLLNSSTGRRGLSRLRASTRNWKEKAAELMSEEAGEESTGGTQDSPMLALLGGGLIFYGVRRADVLGAGATTLGVTLMSKSHPTIRRIVRSPLVSQLIPSVKAG